MGQDGAAGAGMGRNATGQDSIARDRMERDWTVRKRKRRTGT